MEKSQITIDVKPKGIESAYIFAPFVIGKETIESQGYRLQLLTLTAFS